MAHKSCYINQMKITDNIILTGMPAAGKSTVGVILAKKMGFAFLDTDVYIQTREAKLLPEIIKNKGVAGFCSIEEQHVLSITIKRHVIATGGSVIYGNEGMTHLKKSGTIVYLETSTEILLSRIIDPEQRGVAKQPGQTIKSLYEERHPLYLSFADIVINCNNSASPVQTADEIIHRLNR